MANFSGFARPKSNFYRLPNDWFDIWRQARAELSGGSRPARILGPLKIVEYVIKYTWGRTNFDEPVRLSRSDLRKGVRVKHRKRLDRGTGLGSEATISRGIATALLLGLLEQVEINQDPARQQRLYLPHLRPPEEEETPAARRPALGFDRPEANFFLVPQYWTDISAETRSEILIMAIEYFFRHTWGWQTGEREIRWMDADDVANGRKYRSARRRGDRFDRGTGYTTRKLRNALEEGVKRSLLVWRYGEVAKEYALRMVWMETVGDDGYLGDRETTLAGDQTVGGRDQSVGGKDRIVGGRDQAVGDKDQTVGGEDQPVEGGDQTVEDRDQPVDRTFKDTSKDTLGDTAYKTLAEDTEETTTRHRSHDNVVVANLSIVVDPKQEQRSSAFFRSEFELQRLFSSAGLSGTGLDKLCSKNPPPEPLQVQAVILYAEANNLGPGYIYRHLESGAAVDEAFLQFAALDGETLSLFREAVGELKQSGMLVPEIRTPIPENLTGLFAEFARAFTGLETSAVMAALHRGGTAFDRVQTAAPPRLKAPAENRPGRDDLDRLWDQVLGQLQMQMTMATFDAWVKDTKLIARDGPRFTVATKSAFAKDWLENRLFATIRRTMSSLAVVDGQKLAAEIEIDFVVEARF